MRDSRRIAFDASRHCDSACLDHLGYPVRFQNLHEGLDFVRRARNFGDERRRVDIDYARVKNLDQLKHFGPSIGWYRDFDECHVSHDSGRIRDVLDGQAR